MENEVKYGEGQLVECTSITEKNVENLKVGNVYTVVGFSVFDNNVVYSLKDIYGKMYYSIDRFMPYEHPISSCRIHTSNIFPKPVENVQDPVYDVVNKPKHYNQYRVEVIDIIEDATKGVEGIEAVCMGNVIKYVLRHRFKNGVEDLKKARFYLDKLINSMEDK